MGSQLPGPLSCAQKGIRDPLQVGIHSFTNGRYSVSKLRSPAFARNLRVDPIE